jgi:HEAT repeat protein
MIAMTTSSSMREKPPRPARAVSRRLEHATGILLPRCSKVVPLCVLCLVGCGFGHKPAYEDKSVAELIEMLRAPEPQRRAQAAYALGQQGEGAKAAVPELTKALTDKNLQVRTQATIALGRLGPAATPVAAALTKGLLDPDAALRRHSAVALGRLGPAAKSALPALRRASRDEAPIVRQAAEEAIKLIQARS